MIQHQFDEERIFHVACGLEDGDLREEYLTQICAGDQLLRERVEELLAVHEKDESFLKSQSEHEPIAPFPENAEGVGNQIGRFKLLQKIGEGGFGVVYLAEQSRPVRRKVALKVIKPGMDTSAVVARFEAERQALALMDHPNIAKVLDGGATESGRPYFVMELVKGVPVTQFCDENKFSIRQRLELFITICRAIQHAHQKGIIHRDIKPSNVLVTLHDGEPVPKVIDFGVSKAISQQLTEKTLFTAHGQMIGTPLYMSPEQAEMSGLDIDTRSDIYSLGILLYELLTGVTPLDPEKIRSTSYAELQRLIREDEPVEPSRRCSTLGELSATIATRRKTDPHKLGSLLRGELDWIVMKTLEKDRNRRYETPSALAGDVEHFLNDETVTACPPSVAYRFQKFARRNKTLLLTGGSIALLLLASTLISTTLYIKAIEAESGARKAEDDAKTERDLARKTLKEKQEVLAEKEAALSDNADLRKQQMIEVAFSLAASNEFDEAYRRIEEAGIADADRTELRRMLDAERKIMDGEPRTAAQILENLKPAEDDVILQAMLANAYFDANEFWSYFRQPVVHNDVTPETPYEELFVGKALFWLNFEQSIKDLNDATILTSSPLSFLYRARTSALLACSLRGTNPPKSLKLIDQAVKDMEIAMRLFASRSADGREPVLSPAVKGTSLLVLLHAYDIYSQQARDSRREGRDQQSDELETQVNRVMALAEDLFRELSERDDLAKFGYVRTWMSFYLKRKAARLEDQGQHQAALEIYDLSDADNPARKLLQGTSHEAWLLVADDVRKGTTEESNGVRATDADAPIFVVALRLMMNQNDAIDVRRERVRKLIDRTRHKSDFGIGDVLQICDIYTLIGDVAACREFASQQLRESHLAQNLPYAKIALKFFANQISADEFVQQGRNSGATTFRLLMTGLTALAEGRREDALERLHRVANEGIFHTWEFELALAFAARMENDSSWPDWLNPAP